MAYQALYREWRPQTFGAIIGQEHITRTLKNAVESGRVGHAYLFCGARGTGKTSTAKVLAKALNCLQPDGPEPCNQCDNCIAVTEGFSVDVMEIDAASNRGIDEIRDLREKVQFSPATGRYRVFIIDEVHMLTNEAFNALLKTLEEPPDHVVLILATTEPHKIPLTILSRCQRFDFKQITPAGIIGRLQEVAAGAQLSVEEEALRLIARAAEGGLRDALSLLDQAAAFGALTITADDIHNLLGTVRLDALSRMAGCLAAGDAGEALRLAGRLAAEGKDLRLFAREMAAYLRALLMEKIAPGTAALEAWDTAELQAGMAEFTEERLVQAVEIMAKAEQEMKWATLPGIVLELALIKACRQGGTELAALEARVSALEERFNLEEKSNRNISGGLGRELQANSPPVTGGKKATGVTKQVAAAVEKKQPVAPQPPQGQNHRAKPAGEPVKHQAAPAKPETSRPGTDKPAQPGAKQNMSLEEVRQLWPQVLESIRQERLPVYANYIKSAPLEVKGFSLVVGFPEEDELCRTIAEAPANKQFLEGLLNRFLPGNWQIACKSYQGKINMPEPKRAAKAPLADIKDQFEGEEIEFDDDFDRLF
jgi:DNA polymerase-3 subunit gamma/tau